MLQVAEAAISDAAVASLLMKELDVSINDAALLVHKLREHRADKGGTQ